MNHQTARRLGEVHVPLEDAGHDRRLHKRTRARARRRSRVCIFK